MPRRPTSRSSLCSAARVRARSCINRERIPGLTAIGPLCVRQGRVDLDQLPIDRRNVSLSFMDLLTARHSRRLGLFRLPSRHERRGQRLVPLCTACFARGARSKIAIESSS